MRQHLPLLLGLTLFACRSSDAPAPRGAERYYGMGLPDTVLPALDALYSSEFNSLCKNSQTLVVNATPKIVAHFIKQHPEQRVLSGSAFERAHPRWNNMRTLNAVGLNFYVQKIGPTNLVVIAGVYDSPVAGEDYRYDLSWDARGNRWRVKSKRLYSIS